jgi:hypothetical protein
MMVTKMKLALVALAAGLGLAGVGVASYQALTAGEPEAEPPAKVTSAEERVERIKKRIGVLQQELRRAEEAAARERELPPRGPVAVIFGDERITRDELADHFLSRLLPGQLEGYINRRVLEHACRKAGITVTAEEVDAALKEELTKGNLPEGAFRARLREQKQTLRTWKEDVLRPKLLLAKLRRRRTRVTEKDLRQAYKAEYGVRVECEFLVFPPAQKEEARRTAERIRKGEETFENVHRRLPHPAKRTIVLGRQGTGLEDVEQAAFALRLGEVSRALEVRNAIVILKAVRRIAPDHSTRFEDVREELKRKLQNQRLREDEAAFLKRLKAEARVKLLWRPATEEAAP